MSELSNLIDRLKQGIENNSSFVKTIRHPQLLVISLQELHDMIGNQEIKDTIADQVSHLIMLRRRAVDNPKIKEGGMMLNIVLKGDAGVGKTFCATKIAKILYSLGYIDGSKNPAANKPSLLGSVFGDTTGNSSSTEDSTAMTLYILFIFIIILVTFMSIAWSFYEKFGGIWTIAIIILILFSIILVGVWISSSMDNSNNSNNSNENIVGSKENKENKVDENVEGAAPTPSGSLKLPTDDQIVKIVTRADFIDKYVGWTDKKTIKLLNDNLGKVLFVDEAYSLINGPHDEFGMEALTALNLFLSQHPNEIIIIFAGYKDLLETGPFAVQPGLKRRFMYHFDCKGYTPDELYLIFKSQLDKNGWGLIDEPNTLKLFQANPDAFPAFGGDTERAGHFSELAHSREYIKNGKDMELNKLSVNHVKRGIEQLRRNNVDDSQAESSNPLANMMKMMSSKKNESVLNHNMNRANF